MRLQALIRGAIALLIAALAACSATAKVIKAYSGPERSDREVAILFTPQIKSPSIERSGALLAAVDGNTVGSFMDGYPAATKVLPGTYLIKVGCPSLLQNRNMDFRLLRATFEAGHYYELICAQFSATAVDRGTSFSSVAPLLPDSLKEQLRR